MSEQLAFGRLVTGLSPWLGQLVFVGGWAFRLYRLHPGAEVPAYRPVVTLDADVAFAEGERLEGNIRARLLDTGFVESLMGSHRPPVSQYTLGDDASGFYAEFLTPLTGSGRRRMQLPRFRRPVSAAGAHSGPEPAGMPLGCGPFQKENQEKHLRAARKNAARRCFLFQKQQAVSTRLRRRG